jgi:CheY-like chemotaxis protein
VTIRVVLVDDQALLRTAFRVIFEETDDIHVVGEAAEGAGAVDVVRRTRPDVVLMDIRMPGTDGIEATRRICAPISGSAPRVLILTTFDLCRAARRRQRLPAQGRSRGGSALRRAYGRLGRGGHRAERHPPSHRALPDLGYECGLVPIRE